MLFLSYLGVFLSGVLVLFLSCRQIVFNYGWREHVDNAWLVIIVLVAGLCVLYGGLGLIDCYYIATYKGVY